LGGGGFAACGRACFSLSARFHSVLRNSAEIPRPRPFLFGANFLLECSGAGVVSSSSIGAAKLNRAQA